MTNGAIKHLTIICYKWGTRYSARDVNILHASVRRNLSVPHRFVCLTEDPAGLDPDIEIAPLPDQGRIGNGTKLYTFSDEFLGLGPEDFVVSLDVDIVIVDSLDFLAERPDLDFVIARHRASHADARGHGAVYRLRVGSHPAIWTDFIAAPEDWAARLPGKSGNAFSEQRWLEQHFEGQSIDYFPAGKIIIFRVDCKARSISHVLGRKAGLCGLTTAFLGTARLPGKGESIVSFSGRTKPKDVLGRHHGHLKRAPFVAQHWRL